MNDAGPRSGRSWAPRFPILIVFALGLALRLIALGSRGIWYDDAFSIFLARNSFEDIVSGTAADTMPPLYYFLLHLWMVFGQGVVWLRMLNVALSMGILWLVYLLAGRFLGRKTAFWATTLTAVSPLQIYHAQELRMYALLAFSLLGYTFFFLKLLREPHQGRSAWRSWAGLVVFAAIAMYTHNLAVFTLLVPNIYLLLRRKLRFLGQLCLADLAILLLASPWLVILPGQIAKIQAAFWTPRPGLLEVVQAIMAMHTNLPVPSAILPVSLASSLLAVALVGFEVLRSRPAPQPIAALATLAIAPALLLFVVSYGMRPVFVPRALMLSSLAYTVLAAWVVAERPAPRLVRGLLLTLFLVPAALVLPSQYLYEDFPRSPFRELTEELTQVVSPDDLVLHDNKLSFFPAYYYAPTLNQSFLPDETGSHNDTLAAATQEAMGIYPALSIAAATAGENRVWYIVFEETLTEYSELGYAVHPNLLWLRQELDQGRTLQVGDLLAYEFRR